MKLKKKEETKTNEKHKINHERKKISVAHLNYMYYRLGVCVRAYAVHMIEVCCPKMRHIAKLT